MNAKLLYGRMISATIVLLMSASAALAADASQAAPMDWPHWRGPEMNGISREKGLVESWSPAGENVLWQRDDLGSRSTPIVMDGRLYTICRDQPGTKKEGEKVVCVDAKTGKTIWEQRFNVFLSDVPDTRVGWSSVVGDPETGKVFALGVCDLFLCMDGETGEVLWKHSLAEEYGALNTYGGRTNFPIVYDNLVIISSIVIGWGEMAKPAHRFIAFDIRNGQPVWYTGTRLLPYDTTYSSPVTAVLDGQAAIVFGSGDGGIHAFQPRTGKNIWTYNVSRRGINTTPLVDGTTVYAGHSEENLNSPEMGALFAIDGSKSGDITESGELWRNMEWMVGKSAPLLVDGRLYAIDDKARLYVVDPKTGEEIYSKKLGTQQRSSMLYADGKIYICTANGRWYTLKPTEDGVEILHRDRLQDAEGNAYASHGSPIVSHGRLYIPTTLSLFCVGKEDVEPKADPRPEPPKETPVGEDQEPAHVQIVPVESLLKPGTEKDTVQDFHVRLYNKNGQYLKLAPAEDVEFSIEGPGEISDTGTYTVPRDGNHSAVIVTAKVGDLAGSARIRVVPELDWEFTFDDGEVPVTWVGARYRHIALDFDLLQALKKKDSRAEQLYIYFRTTFVNSGKPAATFDNSTPRRTWDGLLRFLNLFGEVTNLEQAKAALDPSLTLLKEEGFLQDWTWENVDGVGTKLTINQGPRKVEGNGVICKITTIPKGTSSRCWMGHPEFSNYTIEADVYGAVKKDKMPDIGLIGQRYNFLMLGASQQLQIRTWKPQLRMASTVDYAWKPETWYTMKLQASVEDGKAVLRGKVWERGKPEPSDWSIEAVDETPNLIGSPGMFGNARDAEIYVDNVKVYKNETSDDSPAQPDEKKPNKAG